MSDARRLVGIVLLAVGLGAVAGHPHAINTVLILMVYMGLMLLVPHEDDETHQRCEVPQNAGLDLGGWKVSPHESEPTPTVDECAKYGNKPTWQRRL